MLSEKFKESLATFLMGEWPLIAQREWLEDRTIKVYMRKGHHYINGARYKTLDIANVAVVESHQRQGMYSELLELLKIAAQQQGAALYVENVINATQYPLYLRRGFTKLQPFEDGWPCYYILPKECA